MYAIFNKGAIVYLSKSYNRAENMLGTFGEGSIMVNVNDLEMLYEVFQKHWSISDKEDAEDETPINNLLNKLDEMGINAHTAEELAEQLKSESEKLVRDVKALGSKGVMSIGECLSTLGEAIQRHSKK